MLLSERGIYEIDDVAIHRNDPTPERRSLNQSLAQVLLSSCPKAAWWQHPGLNPAFKPQEPSKEMDLGTVAHVLLTDKGASYQIIEADSYRKKDAQTQRNAFHAAGIIPILRPKYETAVGMIAALRRQLDRIEHGKYAFNKQFGVCEVCAVCNDVVGCWSRALIDFYGASIPTGIEVWDYKTTSGTANPRSLMPHMTRMGWAFQAAFIDRICVQIKPSLAGKIRFRFLVQEVEEPYLCSVIEPDPGAMTLAHKQVAGALHIWKRCLDKDDWPAYPTHAVPVGVLPSSEAQWLSRELDDELIQLAANDPFLSGTFLTAGSPLPAGKKASPQKRQRLERDKSILPDRTDELPT